MKKIMITLCLVLFTSSAFAGSCPMMAKNIDAHKAGDHAKSEELLGKALDLFKS